MPQADAGSSIITTASIQGFDPSSALVDYAMTKAALVAFTKALAEERPELAIAEATTALDDLERLEAARDADAAAALVRSLGGPARTGPKGVGSLTQREAEVLDLLGHGLSNPEIGERLFISRKTVEHHVGRLLAKLGLRSRAEAAAYATRQAAEGIRD